MRFSHACICPGVAMVTLCMFARLEASEMENEARVDQSREPCRNFPLILCRQSATQKANVPVRASSSNLVFPTAQGGKKSQSTTVIPGSVQVNLSSPSRVQQVGIS